MITAACDYVKESGLPFYCTREQWDTFRNKDLFKKFCISAGLPVVPQFEIDVNDISGSAETLPYPVVTKPSDSAGSKGFSVCKNAEEFLIGYKKAFDNSFSGKVIVEKFVKNNSVYVFYNFSEGKIIFTGLCRRYPVLYENTGSYIAGLLLFKSKSENDFRRRFENKLVQAFKSLNLREGVLWLEIFFDGDKYYFNEAGYREPGSGAVYASDYFYNVNQIHADIYYALTGKSCVYGHKSLIPENFRRKKYYGIYAVHSKAGTIAEITGTDKISGRDDVVTVIEKNSVGDTVEPSGTIAQIFAWVHFVFDTREELFEIADDIHEKIIVKDTEGNNMVNRMIDARKETEDFF